MGIAPHFTSIVADVLPDTIQTNTRNPAPSATLLRKNMIAVRMATGKTMNVNHKFALSAKPDGIYYR